MSESTVVLTGATSGIGLATALVMAQRADRLILHGLEPEARVGDVLQSVRASMRHNTHLSYFSADFTRLAEVVRLAEEIRGVTDGIDLLVNNAARPGSQTRTVTAAGNELTLQTNYLAPVALTTRLLDLVGKVASGRILNIASATHLSTTLRIHDLNLAHHPYSAAEAYAHSKLALVTYTCWLAAHRSNPMLDVVSMHPGVSSTGLLHAMFSVAGDRPQRAAASIAHVAFRHGDNGTYYDERTPRPPNPEALNPAVQEQLHEATSPLLP